MIGRLRGILIEKQPPEVVLDVSGVGYEIQLPMSSFYPLPDIGEEAVIFTHFVVREDAQLLYGFADKHERAMFRELIKVNGVGPKLALAILSGMSANQFVQCIHNDAVSSLVKLPGVGKKTAERLVVEMKDRLKNWVGADLLTPEADKMAFDNGIENTVVSGNAIDEAVSALVALGYKPASAEKAIKQVNKPGMDCEALIRSSLKSML
ncbi:Holliday junction branch migration protein RuvA [Psychromonas sp. psych-6C06]|uniref:Holliday junction branch migration protein RuvA n=1 Tax=Psychromonas sp. psych-6C06 TaxID=2058089 RepID=UPI000C343BE8|nr:Holliday junction branch migration protein RuvA [Psychromonas sp. psych-6C06]PKF63343.1 Holliday junction branch migration protein RuvA [Psychromonas sp. psych-6C06]